MVELLDKISSREYLTKRDSYTRYAVQIFIVVGLYGCYDWASFNSNRSNLPYSFLASSFLYNFLFYTFYLTIAFCAMWCTWHVFKLTRYREAVFGGAALAAFTMLLTGLLVGDSAHPFTHASFIKYYLSIAAVYTTISVVLIELIIAVLKRYPLH